MLKTKLLHPEIFRALGGQATTRRSSSPTGIIHFVSAPGPNATVVYLNLTAGIPKTTDVLEVLLETIPIQEAALMQPPNGEKPPIHDEYIKVLPQGLPVKQLERFAFYDAVCSPWTSLVIATGKSRRFANLLLTIGVVKLELSERY